MTAPAAPSSPDDPGVDHGEVFTRRWVVEMILDLVGYTPDVDLATKVVVEPSCGTGAFLVPIVDRLVESCRRHGRDITVHPKAVRAFDVLAVNTERARKAVAQRLVESGTSPADADELAATWACTDDFLLADDVGDPADYVVGNPPYVRLERVAHEVMQAYRAAWPTMRGRSDLYVGFIQRGLELLADDGVLGFICADRWMKNQYGAALRQMVSDGFAVDTIVTMHDTDAFEHEVSAYPAVFTLRNAPQREAVVAEASGAFGSDDVTDLLRVARGPDASTKAKQTEQPPDATASTFRASRVKRWFQGGDLWPTGSPDRLAMVLDLEARLPPLQDEATGTRVGIGLATGCDDVYITADPVDVEPERLLPLLRADDLHDGVVEWSGARLVNPWNGRGLVDLDTYPRLRGYLRPHEPRLKARHTARKHPAGWYRTIDRVTPGLLDRPKLVLPDLKARAHPVLDPGGHYPHHNLYYVVSDRWDLEVLGGLLLSDLANLLVGAYCVRMRGGCYRFQAQYLRRIRVPAIDTVNDEAAESLRIAFRSRDRHAATTVAAQLCDIDPVALAAVCAL